MYVIYTKRLLVYTNLNSENSKKQLLSHIQFLPPFQTISIYRNNTALFCLYTLQNAFIAFIISYLPLLQSEKACKLAFCGIIRNRSGPIFLIYVSSTPT